MALKILNKPVKEIDLGQGLKQNAGGRLIKAHESPTGKPIEPGQTFVAPEDWFETRRHWKGLKVLEELPDDHPPTLKELRERAMTAEERARIAEEHAENARIVTDRTAKNLERKIQALLDLGDLDDEQAERLADLEEAYELLTGEVLEVEEVEETDPAEPVDDSAGERDDEGLVETLHAGVRLLAYRQLQKVAKALDQNAGLAADELLAGLLQVDPEVLGKAVRDSLTEEDLAELRAKLEGSGEEE